MTFDLDGAGRDGSRGSWLKRYHKEVAEAAQQAVKALQEAVEEAVEVGNLPKLTEWTTVLTPREDDCEALVADLRKFEAEYLGPGRARQRVEGV